MIPEQENARNMQLEMGAQTRRYLVPIPTMPMQNMRRIPSTYVNRTFAFWTVSAGCGLVTMGSILTYIFQDQAKFVNDPFRTTLQGVSIIFIIIGILLIISSLIKIVAMMLNNSDSTSGPSCCGYDDSDDNEVKPTSTIPENTIVYNPYYPPILVPYNISSGQYPGNELGDPNLRNPNLSFLPGSLFVNESEKKQEAPPYEETSSSDETKDNLVILEDHDDEENEQQLHIDENDENPSMKKYMTASATERAQLKKY